MTMKAKSSVFNVVSNSEEMEGDDILMEEQEENGDDTADMASPYQPSRR